MSSSPRGATRSKLLSSACSSRLIVLVSLAWVTHPASRVRKRCTRGATAETPSVNRQMVLDENRAWRLLGCVLVLSGRKPNLRRAQFVNAVRSVFWFVPRRRVRALGSGVLVMGLVALWLLSASTAPAPAADTDLTQSALAARAAVGLPTVAESAAVLAAAGSVLDGTDATKTFL